MIPMINPVNYKNLVKIMVQTSFAPANGKLYFEFLKIFSVPENTCPCRGLKTLPKSAFF